MELDNWDHEDRINFGYEGEQKMPEFTVTRLADGLGYGEGSVSTVDRADVTTEDVAAGEAVIESEKVLVEVDRDKNGEPINDDGCGDGRGVKEVWEGMVRRFKSLNRAKVFGAGVAMAAADDIGSGNARGKSLMDVFMDGIDTLKNVGMKFGAHTAEHVHGDGCGCGAIDEAPKVVKNAVKYENQIRENVDLLGVDTEGLDEIFTNYREFDAAQPKDATFSGAKVMAAIRGVKDVVVKKLAGPHLEYFIVLNLVSGKTVDQGAIREATDGKLQAFAVDVWRLQEIAEKLHPEDTVAQKRAFLSKLVYTLSVGATLTKGDLPVYVVSPSEALVAA